MKYTRPTLYSKSPSFSKPTKANEESQSGVDGLSLIDIQKKPYHFFDQTFSARYLHFYLSEEIGEPSEYTEMVHQILTAGEHDTVFIHLNCPGGQLDTGVQIINAMQQSEAKIITILEGTAYSMGTMIFLAADEMVVNDHCMMMFHNFNGGLIGKGNELTSQLEATVKWFASLAEDIYVPFLTPEEVQRIARGEDLWMQSPEIRDRLIKMVEILAAEGKDDTQYDEVLEEEPKSPKRKQKDVPPAE